MAKYHKWTEEEDKVLIQYVQDKAPLIDIADLMGMKKSAIAARIFSLRKKGIDIPYYNTFEWTEAKEKELVKMIRRNEGNLQSHFRDFAEKYNISVYAVHSRYYHPDIPGGRIKDKYPIFGIFGMFRVAKNSKIYNRTKSKGYNFWSVIKTIF